MIEEIDVFEFVAVADLSLTFLWCSHNNHIVQLHLKQEVHACSRSLVQSCTLACEDVMALCLKDSESAMLAPCARALRSCI